MCPVCSHPIKANGVGSKSSRFSAAVTSLVNKIYPYTCGLFEGAANLHDWRYGQLCFGKERADRLFLADMLKAIKDNDRLNWFTRRWFKYQANKFYIAVKLGGDDAYHNAQMECLKNQSEKVVKNAEDRSK